MKDFKLSDFVIFSIVNILIYSIAEFIAGCFGVSHDILTQYFFGVFGGECLFCALIKVFKLKQKEEFNNEEIDE